MFKKIFLVLLMIIFTLSGCSNADKNDDGCDSEFLAEKPVIYVYGSSYEREPVSVTLNGNITCEYPKRDMGNTWNITTDIAGNIGTQEMKYYKYLYWEGKSNMRLDFTSGFCVKGVDTAPFLEQVLGNLGMTRLESNEFIIYWLPRMEQNEYNIISFQTDNYNNEFQLSTTPYTPNILRVFMAVIPCDEYMEIPKQDLSKVSKNFTRSGLHLVEWGGTIVPKATQTKTETIIESNETSNTNNNVNNNTANGSNNNTGNDSNNNQKPIKTTETTETVYSDTENANNQNVRPSERAKQENQKK